MDYRAVREWRALNCIIHGQEGDPEVVRPFLRTDEARVAFDTVRYAQSIGRTLDIQTFQRILEEAWEGRVDAVHCRGIRPHEVVKMAFEPELQGVSYETEAALLREEYTKQEAASMFSRLAETVTAEPFVSTIRKIEQIAQRFEGLSKKPTNEGFITLFGELVERRAHPDAMPGVPTGIRAVDELIGGLQGGHLIVIGARTGVGKTAIGLQIAGDAALAAGKRCHVVSCEMSESDVLFRVLSQQTGVPGSRIVRGGLPGDLAKLADCVEAFGDLVEVSEPAGTFDLFLGSLREALERGVSCVLIDYIQLLNIDSDKPRHLAVAQVSSELKRLARRYHTPIIALSQLNRESDKGARMPTVADLKDSGAIEQDADVILLLHRDESEATLSVAKNRRGSQGVVSMVYDGPTYTFYEKHKH